MKPEHGHAAASVALILLLAVWANLPQASAYSPKSGDSFKYSETITVDNGQGSYTGYSDQSQVVGMEQVQSVAGSVASSSYSYSYTYSNNQGNTSSGSKSGDYTWSTASFTYINGTDNQVGYSKPIYVWFAMNASVPILGTFYSLNTKLTVTSRNFTLLVPTEGDKYVMTIRAEGSGQYQRNDAYGVFTASYTWTEYFDPATGYIVGYHYVEQDNGQYQGQAGSFTYTDDLYVTDTTYPLVSVNPPSGGTSTETTAVSSASISGSIDLTSAVLVALLIILIAVFVTTRRRRKSGQLPAHSAPPSAPAQWGSNVDLGSRPPEQVVIRDVAKVNCKYCGTLIPTTADRCPYCGGPRR